jgi:hypothetical protein
MSATSELAALRAFAVAALPLVENYKAKRCSYISEHHVQQVDAAIDAMDAWITATEESSKPLKFDVLDLIREPDDFTAAERAQAAEAIAEMADAADHLSFGMPANHGDNVAVIGSCNASALMRIRAALPRIRGAA